MDWLFPELPVKLRKQVRELLCGRACLGCAGSRAPLTGAVALVEPSPSPSASIAVGELVAAVELVEPDALVEAVELLDSVEPVCPPPWP